MGTASTIIAPPRRSPMNPTIRMPSAWGFCRQPAVANSTVPVSGSDRVIRRVAPAPADERGYSTEWIDALVRPLPVRCVLAAAGAVMELRTVRASSRVVFGAGHAVRSLRIDARARRPVRHQFAGLPQAPRIVRSPRTREGGRECLRARRCSAANDPGFTSGEPEAWAARR
jgi:hypothetical protein